MELKNFFFSIKFQTHPSVRYYTINQFPKKEKHISLCNFEIFSFWLEATSFISLSLWVLRFALNSPTFSLRAKCQLELFLYYLDISIWLGHADRLCALNRRNFNAMEICMNSIPYLTFCSILHILLSFIRS